MFWIARDTTGLQGTHLFRGKPEITNGHWFGNANGSIVLGYLENTEYRLDPGECRLLVLKPNNR